MRSYSVSWPRLPYGRSADGKNNVWTVRGKKKSHVNVLLMGFSAVESYVEIIWDSSDVCAKAVLLLVCQLITASCVVHAPGWRVRLSSQGRCLEGNPRLSFPGKSQSSVWPRASRVCLILHLIQKVAQSTNRPPSPGLESSGVAGAGGRIPDVMGQWSVLLHSSCALGNTALFVSSARRLSPVQPRRAGEGSQQHKDWIESCWNCKYLKVSKVSHLQYLSQNQGHYIFYDKIKWAFFFHSFPFHSRMH